MNHPGAVPPTTAHLDFVREYDASATRFWHAIADADLSATVPACPGWRVFDLVVHLGNVHAWAASIVETGKRADMVDDAPRRRSHRRVSAWYRAKAEDLLAVLRSADLTDPAWNFAGVHPTKAFWPRRQTHETQVHLVDLAQASGWDVSLDPLLCTDGVAEVLEVFLPRMRQRGQPADLREPLCIRTTDTDHVWTLTPRHDGPPAVAVRTEPGADLVEGPAEALLRLLWKRGEGAPGLPWEHAEVALVGNTDRIAAFLGSPLTP